MFHLEKVDSLFNCAICTKTLHDPIVLPCGESVCKTHSEEISNAKCHFCSRDHTIPKDGFSPNENLQKQLEVHLYTISINFTQFHDLKKLVQDLNRDLKDIESIRADPKNYIYEYFKELNRQVDLRRDTIIIEVETYSNELIQKIDIIDKDCLAKVTTKTKTTDCIDDCKAELEELNGMFNTFEIDNSKLEEMFSLKRTNELQELMGPLVEDYKRG